MSDDLLDVLRGDPGVDGLSTSDLLAALGWDDTAFFRRKLLERLRVEIKAGRVEHAGDQRRPRIDGRPGKVPVYRVVKP